MEPFYRYWFIGMAAIAALATALGFWLRVRKATLLIIIIPFLLYLSTNNLESIPRYLSVLFPLYLIAALLAQKHPLIEKTITVGSLGFLTLSTVLFVNGYWFT